VDGSTPPLALTDGFQTAFVGGAAVALIGVLVASSWSRAATSPDRSPSRSPALEPA